MGAQAACCDCSTRKPEMIDVQPKASKVNPKNYWTQDEIEFVFKKVDADGNNLIDLAEFADVLEELGVPFTSTSLKEVYDFLDSDGSGGISVEEFLSLFEGRDKRKGLQNLLKTIIRKEHAKKMKEHMKDHPEDENNQKPIDVYIIHGAEEESNSRSWWAHSVLEFADIKCYGDYLLVPREGDTMINQPTSLFHEVTDARVVVILLDKRAKNPEKVAAALEEIDADKMPVCVFVETDRARKQVLAEWKKALPSFAFSRNPRPMSRHYVSDSEQILLEAVTECLGKQVPLLTTVRPPGADLDNFSTLEAPGVRFIMPEYMMVVNPGDGQADLPEDAFESPGCRRPIFVSYANEDPDLPGPSPAQLQSLKDLLRRLRMGGRVFFMDVCSLSDGNLLGGLNVQDCMTLCRYIVLDEVSADAKDKLPYLSRGKNFLEVMTVLLTGNLAPRDKKQFVELDNAVGSEFEKGLNFRKYFRENVDNKHALVDNLCARLKSKQFAHQAEAERAEHFLRSSLERHPLLQDELNWAVGRFSMEKQKSAIRN